MKTDSESAHTKIESDLAHTKMDIDDFILIANGFISGIVNKMLNRTFKTAGLNITTEQWTILCSLWNKDKQSQQALSDNTYKEKASVTRLLDTLERNSYIARCASPTDRRTNVITLTEKGRQLEQKANAIVHAFIYKAIDGVDQKNLIFMKETFYKMYNNLA